MKNAKSSSHPYGLAAAMAFAAALAGCGGGGGGGGSGAPATVPVDTTPPTLAANAQITPTPGATGVAYAATVSFSASEALSSADIQLRCDGAAVPGKTMIARAVATFTPTAPGLVASAQCTATLNGPGTKDMAGNAFASNVTLGSFTVRPLDCPTATTNEAPAYGGSKLVAACGNVFIDPVVPKNLYPGLVALMTSARDANKAAYGSLVAALPDLVVCDSNPCADYFAGPSHRNTTLPPNTYAGQYVTPRMTVVLTSATWNRNQAVLTHELSHVEVNARIGAQHVPAWFDEGLATYIGGEPDCSGVSAKGVADLRTLDLESTWVAYTGNLARFTPTYCQARAEVAAWIAKNGKASVGTLLQGVGHGKSFSTLYGGLLTQ